MTTESGKAATAGEADFWSDGRNALLQRLGTTPEGLSEAEAAERLRHFGPNLAVTSLRRGVLLKIAKRLVEPLIAILLIAALISGATGDWQSLIIIVLIVLASIALDVFQETQAENAVDALRRTVAVQVTVLRSGRPADIPVREVVPGDVVALHAGDLVPADGLILESHDAMADEASLTGEPFPVEKKTASPGDAAIGPDCAVFGGTSLVAGEVRMLVVATGGDTRLGSISRSMQASEPPTAFEHGVHGLGMLILRLTGFLVLLVLLTQLVRHGLSIESFLFAVALAVGLTPELGHACGAAFHARHGAALVLVRRGHLRRSARAVRRRRRDVQDCLVR